MNRSRICSWVVVNIFAWICCFCSSLLCLHVALGVVECSNVGAMMLAIMTCMSFAFLIASMIALASEEEK